LINGRKFGKGGRLGVPTKKEGNTNGGGSGRRVMGAKAAVVRLKRRWGGTSSPSSLRGILQGRGGKEEERTLPASKKELGHWLGHFLPPKCQGNSDPQGGWLVGGTTNPVPHTPFRKSTTRKKQK